MTLDICIKFRLQFGSLPIRGSQQQRQHRGDKFFCSPLIRDTIAQFPVREDDAFICRLLQCGTYGTHSLLSPRLGKTSSGTGTKSCFLLPKQKRQEGEVVTEKHGGDHTVALPHTTAQTAVCGPVQIKVFAFQFRAKRANITEHCSILLSQQELQNAKLGFIALGNGAVDQKCGDKADNQTGQSAQKGGHLVQPENRLGKDIT